MLLALPEAEEEEEEGMTLDAYVNPVTGALEDSPFGKKNADGVGKKKKFKVVCKLCEVQAMMKTREVNGN